MPSPRDLGVLCYNLIRQSKDKCSGFVWCRFQPEFRIYRVEMVEKGEALDSREVQVNMRLSR